MQQLGKMNYSSKYPLPSALETRVSTSRSQTALSYLKVDGLKVKYVGPGTDDSEAATIRTNYPVPPDCPVYYFEVHVVNKGQQGFIGIGFMADDVLLSRLPGWDPHSYGYHGGDGLGFSGSGGQGCAYGPTFTTGDTIGALISRVDNTIRYFKNGQDLGVAFRNMPEERLFPCVGLRTRGEEVQLNLGRPGDPPFATDISRVVATCKDQVMRGLSGVRLPSATPSGMPLLAHLLHQHLLHHRCWHTAQLIQRDLTQARSHGSQQHVSLAGSGGEAGPGPGPGPGGQDPSSMEVTMQASCDAPPTEPPSSSLTPTPEFGSMADLAGSGQLPSASGQAPMDTAQPMQASNGTGTAEALPESPSPHVVLRQSCYELVSSGRVVEAQQLLDAQVGPQLLANNPHLHFRLKVAQFCELVRPGGPDAVETAVAYGRAVLAPHTPKSEADEELLCDALSLLAYEQPATSPCGHLLSQGVRSKLAEDVDRAILLAYGYPPHSTLERLATQAIVTLEALRQANHPQALLLDRNAVLCGP